MKLTILATNGLQESSAAARDVTYRPRASDDYGAWISPSGEVIDVPFQSHGSVAERLAGGMSKAYDAGYVAVVYGPKSRIEYYEPLTQIQIDLIARKMLSSRPRLIELNTIQGRYSTTLKRYDNLADILAFKAPPTPEQIGDNSEYYTTKSDNYFG